VGRFITLDFVLRLILARVMGVAFVIHVFGVHSHNSAGDPAGFRIPTYVISNFEYSCHGRFRAKLYPISRGSALVLPICSIRNIDCQTIAGRRLRYLETVICAVMLG
jgi:hypothetical protein